MVWNKRWLKYQPPGAINYGIAENIDAFTQDKVATAFQWAAVGLAMIDEKNKDKVMVVAAARHAAEGRQHQALVLHRRPALGHQRLQRRGPHAVAIDFLKWWYLPETQLEFAKRGGNPAVKKVLEPPASTISSPGTAPTSTC